MAKDVEGLPTPAAEAKASREYLENGIASYLNDPPDTDFQRGYLAAMLEQYWNGHGRELPNSLAAVPVMLDPKWNEKIVREALALGARFKRKRVGGWTVNDPMGGGNATIQTLYSAADWFVERHKQAQLEPAHRRSAGGCGYFGNTRRCGIG